MQIASLISYLTEPMIVAMGIVLLGGWHAGLRDNAFNTFSVAVVGCSVFIWVLRVLAVHRLRTNWDMSDRKKRVRSLLPLIGICVVFYALISSIGNGELARFGGWLFAWLIGFFLITLKTKISGHMAVLTLFVGLIWLWYGASYAALILALPAVSWSRLTLKRHTPVEVIGGTLYSLVFLLFFVAQTFLW